MSFNLLIKKMQNNSHLYNYIKMIKFYFNSHKKNGKLYKMYVVVGKIMLVMLRD